MAFRKLTTRSIIKLPVEKPQIETKATPPDNSIISKEESFVSAEYIQSLGRIKPIFLATDTYSGTTKKTEFDWTIFQKLATKLIDGNLTEVDLDLIYTNRFLLTNTILNLYHYISYTTKHTAYKGIMKDFKMFGFSYESLNKAKSMGLGYWENILNIMFDYQKQKNKVEFKTLLLNAVLKGRFKWDF